MHFKNNEFVDKIGTKLVGQNVAIALDHVVYSAPVIREQITTPDVRISGDFSEKDASRLAVTLRYGSLPVQFDQKQQTVESVSPSLGKDQLAAGIAAGLIGIGLVGLLEIKDTSFRTDDDVVAVLDACGGGYDANARLVARHLGRHLPGNPTIVINNLPGGGGIRAANTCSIAWRATARSSGPSVMR